MGKELVGRRGSDWPIGGACPPVASAFFDPPISEVCVSKLMVPSLYTLWQWINASAVRRTFVKKYRKTLLHAFTKLLAQRFSLESNLKFRIEIVERFRYSSDGSEEIFYFYLSG